MSRESVWHFTLYTQLFLLGTPSSPGFCDNTVFRSLTFLNYLSQFLIYLLVDLKFFVHFLFILFLILIFRFFFILKVMSFASGVVLIFFFLTLPGFNSDFALESPGKVRKQNCLAPPTEMLLKNSWGGSWVFLFFVKLPR